MKNIKSQELNKRYERFYEMLFYFIAYLYNKTKPYK